MNSTAGAMVLAWLRTITSMLFLAYLGNVELRGGFLAIGFANITGYLVIYGLAMGMKFLSNQANELSVTVLTLQCAALPIDFLWINMERILLWYGVDEITTKMAFDYITYSLVDLHFQAFLQPLKIYLTIQHRTLSVTCCEALALLLHIRFNLLLVHYLDLGIKGVAGASVLSSSFMVFYLGAHLWLNILWEKLCHILTCRSSVDTLPY